MNYTIRSYDHQGIFQSEEVIQYINEKLLATWSPEQIASTSCDLKLPSWRTIYRWIYEKYLVNGDVITSLPFCQRCKASLTLTLAADYRIRFPMSHFQTAVNGLVPLPNGFPLVVFASGFFASTALSFAAQHFQIAIKIPDHKAQTMEDTVVAALSQFPAELVKNYYL